MDILDNLDGMKGMEDIAAGSDSKSCKEKFDSKEKIDKKTIRSLLSTLLPSTNAENNSLPSPFSTQEHFCLPTGQFPILVHDHDLSSIIAYSLVSYDYQKALNSLNATKSSCPGNNDSNGSPNLKRKSTGEM